MKAEYIAVESVLLGKILVLVSANGTFWPMVLAPERAVQQLEAAIHERNAVVEIYRGSAENKVLFFVDNSKRRE